MSGPKILLPFIDDSTLFFANSMADLMSRLDCTPVMTAVRGGPGLSDRQLSALLPGGPDRHMSDRDFLRTDALRGVDAVVTCRMFPTLLQMLGQGPDGDAVSPLEPRPRVIAFQGGLDFTPERAFAHRRRADGVFLLPRGEIETYRARRAAEGLPPQPVGFGHPAFLRPEGRPAPRGTDIVFFAQAVSPLTRRARQHIVAVLAALARRYADRRVVLKLRHLPGENLGHLHRESHPYPALLDKLGDSPQNLVLSANPMADVITNCGLGITCTSTAAADLVKAGIPTMVYLDYVENYLDPLMPPMARLFRGSGLVTPLDRLLALDAREPSSAWLDTMFCPRDLGERLLEMIRAS